MSRRFENLDVLRGVAAMTVMLQHFSGHLWREMPVDSSQSALWLKYLGLDVFDWGRFGVTIFFLISGYVIPLSFSGPTPMRRFLASRLFRLYPAFWLSVAGFAFVAVMTGASITLGRVLANMTMVQALFRQPALSGVYWTLTVELVFYAVAFALFYFRSLEKPVVVGMVALFAIASSVVPKMLSLIGFALPVAYLGYFLAFLFLGALIRQTRNGVKFAKPVMIMVMAALTVALPLVTGALGGGEQTVSLARPVGAMLSIVTAVVVFLLSWSASFPIRRTALNIGAWSYSIYLFHEIVADVVGRYIEISGPLSGFAFVVISSALTIAVAAMVYKFVEQPCIAIGKLFGGPSSSRALAETAP